MESLLKETEARALGGDTSAMIHLAQWYYTGEKGLTRSPLKSLEWILKGAEAGDPIAQRIAGMKVEHGEGTKKDPARAFEWYRRAYEGGDAAACYYLGTFFEGDNKGMEPHLPTAIAYFEEGAKRGCGLSQFNLAYRALSGIDMPRNPMRALELFEEAGRNGVPAAHETLGRLYLEGEAVPRDPDMAFDCFTRALEYFDIDPAISAGDCPIYYALCLLTGTGCTKNLSLGREVLDVAAAAGNLNAAQVLKERSIDNPQILGCFGFGGVPGARDAARKTWDISHLIKAA
jgi:TPR repeat protein